MFPDSYYPLDAAEYWQAVEGQPDHVALGYLRALTHYWGHLHCEGLKDDSEYLRKVCRIEKDQWAEAQEIIFDNDKFFCLMGDQKWHQKRALNDWKEKCEKYEADKQRTKNATAARLAKLAAQRGEANKAPNKKAEESQEGERGLQW